VTVLLHPCPGQRDFEFAHPAYGWVKGLVHEMVHDTGGQWNVEYSQWRNGKSMTLRFQNDMHPDERVVRMPLSRLCKAWPRNPARYSSDCHGGAGMKFRAKVIPSGNAAGVEIPTDVMKALGSGPRPLIAVTVNVASSVADPPAFR